MSERVKAILDKMDGQAAVVVAPNATPLDFALAVMRDSGQPMNRRMKAMEIACKYSHPTIQAIMVGHHDGGFADRLERAVKASRDAKSLTLISAPKDGGRGGEGSKPPGKSPEEVSSNRMGKAFPVPRRF